ncbi:MAG TPA: hypothetical protein VFP21_01200, partial [Solirubrobacterales bacterium]|nr:hypothetical protein [Solirubrobacterales bacterium]
MTLVAPTLTAGPADGSSTTATTATFSWNAVAGATGYKVSLDGSGASGTSPPSQVGILIFENEARSAVESGNNPTFKALEAQYRSYTALVAETHPSLPNYCAMVSGSLLGKDGTDSG